MIAVWVGALGATLTMAWTPWRLTAGLQAVDLADTVIGRTVSPLHVFVMPVLVLLGPIVAAMGGDRGLGALVHPSVFLPVGPVALGVAVIGQFVLTRSVLKVVRERQAKQARDQAVLAGANRRSAGR